jgi:hypothetical protein
MGTWKTQFLTKCSSPVLPLDFANCSKPVLNLAKNIRIATSVDYLTAQEFCCGVKHFMTHYKEMKEDKHFYSWNCGFIETTHMQHMHLVLYAKYWLQTIFHQIKLILLSLNKCKAFMYDVLQENLTISKEKSLVSHFQVTCYAQSIHQERMKHALTLTAAQLSGNTLLQFITAT